jgi:hypothetical protein
MEMTNERPWRYENLFFESDGEGREKATISNVVIVRQNGKHTITAPNEPVWENKDENEVNPILNYLYNKRS